MQNLNKIYVQGRLVADANKISGKDDRSNIGITVACDAGYGDKARTDFIGFTGWASNGLLPYLTKGTNIIVEGHITVTKDGDGKTNHTYLNFDNLMLLPSGGKSGADADTKPAKKTTSKVKKAPVQPALDETDDDDLPY